jgi:ubiquinone/menaquinone biosynthesis C-methylase UbiE
MSQLSATVLTNSSPQPADEFMEDWVSDLLADPLTKCPATVAHFKTVKGIIDARVYLKNTLGFSGWEEGQIKYEDWEKNSAGYNNDIEKYRREIEYDRPTYSHFRMSGQILDVGGGAGVVREFLPSAARLVSVDPYISCPFEVPSSKRSAYSCLSTKLNFLGALAEFIPFRSESFDWVHMRSMLDHVQIPDLALMEAHRVLKGSGHVLIGMYVEGGKSGVISRRDQIKERIKTALCALGFDKWKDHHTWHPTYMNLIRLIEDNGFSIVDVYWQPQFADTVCYVQAKKA